MVTPRRVTAAQVKELWRQVQQGASLRTAAMRANTDRKTARKYRAGGKLPNQARKPRTWRTWPDALAEVWPAVAEQLQREPRLQAKTLWEWLQRTQPGKYPESSHRHFKEAVAQALLLRGSRDFASRAEYWQLVLAVQAQRNAGRAAQLAAERAHLR